MIKQETLEHLANWCRQEERTDEEAFQLFNKMYSFLREYPDMADRGWPAIRDLVERNQK